ncbi:hypothetical protein [Algibacter lectus]|uniref:hypothetical protein n=1 Tax=Algibacter lectus TaxID=221126 RepID=UPI0026EE83B1|nr:hypothetical protein [Algibacter lectus]MDO7138909.1 hypothetical protein [Algibacter lectus]
MSKTINEVIKPILKKISLEALNKAENSIKNEIEEKIEHLEFYEKLKFVSSKYNQIKKLIDDSDHPNYARSVDTEDWLLYQFSSRLVLYGEKEYNGLQEALYLGYYKLKLGKIEFRIKRQMPSYSFNDFKDGNIDKHFDLDLHLFNMEEEDKDEINAWQTDSLINIVSYELELLMVNFEKHCSEVDNRIEFINREIAILEKDLNPTISSGKEIKGVLSQLSLFNNIKLDSFNDEHLLLNYPIFFDKKLNYSKLSPSNIGEVLKKIAKDPKVLCSNEFTVFYTLKAFLKQLNILVNEEPEPTNGGIPYSIPFNLIKDYLDEVETKCESLKDQIHDYVYNSQVARNDIETNLKERFEKYITQYYDMKNKEVFSLLVEDKRDFLISDLKINILLNSKIKKYLKNFKKAYILKNTSLVIINVYNDYFKTRSIYSIDSPATYLQVTSLVNKLIIDKEIDYVINVFMHRFLGEFSNYCLPLDFFFYTHYKMITRLFNMGINLFSDVMEDAKHDNKSHYLHSRLKDLKYYMFKLKNEMDENCDYKEEAEKYPKLFLELLSIEVDFIQNTSHLKPLHIPSNSIIPLLGENEDYNFENFVNKNTQDYILRLLEDLCITVGGKNTLSERKKGAIRGVVDALLHEKVIPSLESLTLHQIIGDKIDLKIKSKLDVSNISTDFKKKTLEYIKNTPL